MTTINNSISEYWNTHVHDLEVATAPVGTLSFYRQLDEYRFDKLRYLPNVVHFEGFADKKLLEVGCGAGIDLVRFAEGGAVTTGIDLSPKAIELARNYFKQRNLLGDFQVMDGESMTFSDETFDAVYAHGVLQYTSNPFKMVEEIYRVLKPGGQAILMVYNKYSWLNALSKVMNVGLEHEDAPYLRKYSIGEFRRMLEPFDAVEILPERFPVPTKLHHGWKGALYNNVFVGLFNVLPKSWVRPLGWHLIAFGNKVVQPHIITANAA